MLLSKTKIAFLVLFTGLTIWAEKNQNQGDCLSCHDKQISKHEVNNSSHKDLKCTACHIADNKKVISPKTCVSNFTKTDCNRCHEKQVKEHSQSVHNGDRLPISCASCHSDIHKLQSAKLNKIEITKMCSDCHSRQKAFFQSSHYTALEKGNQDSATCTDCHGLHDIKKVDNDAKGRVFHTKTCLQCHDNKDMMIKSKLSPVAGETYFKSFHGKNVHLGYPEKVAGCSDCHTSHTVLSVKDPNSSIHKDNIVKTCTQCHENIGSSFALFAPHGDDSDKDNFSFLYWTRISMTGLLIGTFMFFWLHSVLWAFRAFVERYQHAKLNHGRIVEKKVHSEDSRLFRRFEKKHIFLHIVVVVSFLTLSITGLPLKFSQTGWAKKILDIIGGAETARNLHHTSAVITFGYFLIAIIMSLKFLFFDKKQSGTWTQRLFGPDSLFPNKRDFSDLKAMFKWFFFRGPKPTFERWTYWEKFDFLAVFWGMFAIGLSGLMLWFPEFFSHLLPGWMFNVATIIHSDEALLATGFIFTVHFFNTHLRPEKFPMDFVIFNGQLTKEEMLSERADQWKRLEKEGRIAEIIVEKPTSLVWDLSLKLFGFAAVLVGLMLAVGMVYAEFLSK